MLSTTTRTYEGLKSPTQAELRLTNSLPLAPGLDVVLWVAAATAVCSVEVIVVCRRPSFVQICVSNEECLDKHP